MPPIGPAFLAAILSPGATIAVMQEVRSKGGAIQGERGDFHGRSTIYVDGQEVASGEMRTQPAKFTLSGDGLCIGYDGGDAVSSVYEAPGAASGATIQAVGVTVKGEPHLDLEAEAKRLMKRAGNALPRGQGPADPAGLVHDADRHQVIPGWPAPPGAGLASAARNRQGVTGADRRP